MVQHLFPVSLKGLKIVKNETIIFYNTLISYINRKPNRWCEPYSPEQNYVLEGLVYGKIYGMCDNTFSGPGNKFIAHALLPDKTSLQPTVLLKPIK